MDRLRFFGSSVLRFFGSYPASCFGWLCGVPPLRFGFCEPLIAAKAVGSSVLRVSKGGFDALERILLRMS